jgi:iron complex transport system substrate-binding protein
VPVVRIASLVPSTTEIVAALGLGDALVARTHECDHPAEVAGVAPVTRDLLPGGLSPAEIDGAVARSVADRHTIYALDEGALRAARPDVVLTQSTCAVCAVDRSAVDAACTMGDARVVSYDPATLPGILEGIHDVARALGRPEEGERLVDDLRGRLDAVAARADGRDRPRVAAVEWPDPLYAPGHWLPDLVEAAGGRSVFGASGARSVRSSVSDLCATRPDVVVLAFCGYDLATTERLAGELGEQPAWAPVRELGVPVVCVDGSAHFSRPGPRVVDGVERLAGLLDAVA